MKIFLDFDDTVFNTKQFKKDYARLFFSYGIKKLEFDGEYYSEERGREGIVRRHDPRAMIARLEKRKGIELMGLHQDLKKMLKELESYVFEDFFQFVRNFKKHQLYLISFGDKFFQKKKIDGSGISNFFAVVKVTDKNKGTLFKELARKNPNEQMFFVDDRPDQLCQVVGLKNAFPIRLRRPEGRYNRLKPLSGCRECDDLSLAARIIKAQVDEKVIRS